MKKTGPLDRLIDWAENTFESAIFISRWIQAPIYGALIVAALLYAVKSLQELVHLVTHFRQASETDIMIAILSLVDISMVANLVNMVVIGGYVTFVSKIKFGEHQDRPDWLDHINTNSLKIKLAGSLASISAIHILKSFIDLKLGAGLANPLAEKALFWQCVIHGVFLVSMLFFAFSEWIQTQTHKAH